MTINSPKPLTQPVQIKKAEESNAQEVKIDNVKEKIKSEMEQEDWAKPLDPDAPPLASIKCPSTLTHEVEMYNKIMEFEHNAYNPSKKGFKTGFDTVDMALEGLQTGFHMIAGDSNMGKSAFMTQLEVQVADLNSDAFVMSFSLDDPMRDKIPRVVGTANKVLINAVRDPIRYAQYPEMIKRRNEGMEKLVNMVDRLAIYDASFSCDIEKIEEEIKRIKILLSENGIKKRIVVFIDNFHDLDASAPEARGGDKQKYDYLAQKVSDMATELDIPIVCTGEFRKLNGHRRPTVDDIRESVKIKYEAKSILLIYNEVSLKGEGAQIAFEVTGKPGKQPIFEIKFGKNKYGSFKGRAFCYFYPEMAHMREVEANVAKNFNNLLYSSGQ